MPFSQLFRSKKHHSPLPAPLLHQKTTTKQNKKYDKWLTKSAYSKAKQVFLGFVFQAVGFNFVSAFIENASYRPQSEDELENKLQTIHHKFQVTLKALHPQQKWSNIDDADKKNFKELKEKNYVYLPSKGWRSGESARLPPMWPGFNAICGLSLLLVLSFAPRGFSPGTPVFPSPQKPTLHSNSIWDARARLNEFIWTLRRFVGKKAKQLAIKALNSASYNKTHKHGSPLITSVTPTLTNKKPRLIEDLPTKWIPSLCPKKLPRVKHVSAHILPFHQDPQNRPR